MIDGDFAREVVRATVQHLLGLVSPAGRFVYIHRLNAPDDQRDGYNVLRHCGTAWYICKAIAELPCRLSPAESRALGRVVGHIEAQLREPPWKEGSLPRLCLPEDGSVKLGANGLALLMLDEYARLDAEARPSAPPDPMLMARLQNYVLSQQSGGDFVHKRAFPGGAIEPFRSDFYTGECLFALARGDRITPHAARAVEHLLASGYGIQVQSHWMAYAVCEMLDRKLTSSPLLLAYLSRLVAHIVQDASYRNRNESTPIACRTEALLRVLLLARRHAMTLRFDPRLIAAARQAAEENLRMQAGFYADGQFVNAPREALVRIDYIQHNATCFLQWLKLLR